MSHHLKLTGVVLALALAGGATLGVSPAHAARTAAIMQVENEPLPANASLAQVETAVLQALSNRGWTIMNRSAGKVEAQYARKDFSVNVEVAYSKSAFSVTYKDSTGLNYDAGKNKIHANYNRWVNNLKVDIPRLVSNAVMGAPPPQ